VQDQAVAKRQLLGIEYDSIGVLNKRVAVMHQRSWRMTPPQCAHSDAALYWLLWCQLAAELANI
jgi:hypothetical protein